MPMPTQDPTALSVAATKALSDIREAFKGFAPISDLVALQTKFASIEDHLKQQQLQMDSIDIGNSVRHHGGNFGALTLEKLLKEDESVNRFIGDKGRGRCFIKFEGPDQMGALFRKTIISGTGTGSSGSDTLNAVGISSTGVLTIDRTPGVTLEARQKLTIENVLSSAPTSQAAVDFIKVSSPMAIASPVAEGAVKPEQSMSFSAHSEKVRTIASWIPATRQVLDDMPSLAAIISGSLLFYLGLEVELQILSGDSTGENLNGILNQASAFNSALLPPASAGWTRLDVIAQAINQINLAKELDPSFVVLNVQDYWKLRLTKNTFGGYILGSPNLPGEPTIFGLTPVPTTSIAAGTFLVGSGNPAAASIRNRMEAVVEISDSHASFFTSNLLAIRGERRLAMLTMRPGSFVTGQFSTSPAS